MIFLSGDDFDARSQVAKLFRDAGFSAIELGDLATGCAMQQVGGPLAGANLSRSLQPADPAGRAPLETATMRRMGGGTERVRGARRLWSPPA